MSAADKSSHRGAALLLVLATLVLVTTASVSLMRLAVTAQAARISAKEAQIADDLLAAVEAPILDWLNTQAGDMVLAPEVATPQVAVLEQSWSVDELPCGLQVTAWDQCGMVPVNVARSGSPLRASLPEEIRRTLDRVSLRTGQPAGLDLFLGRHEDDRVPVFPKPFAEESESVTIGAMVATHNPNVINVNTAPPEILEAALRVAGRGGLEAILAARAEGTVFSLGGLPSAGRSSDRSLRLAAASTAWAFRIDVHVGMVRRSWWAVYVGTGPGGWECTHRLAIPE